MLVSDKLSATKDVTPRSVLMTMLGVIVAVYLPFVWALSGRDPLRMFLFMPSGWATVVVLMLTGWERSHWVGVTITALMVMGLTYWGRKGGGRRAAAIAIAFMWSAITSVATSIFVHGHS